MDSQVQEIKDKLNIVDVVEQYVTLKRAGRTYLARCPFHNERTPSFHVSPERGTYKCFGCGEGGDIFTFVEKMEGIDFPTALKQLAEKAGVKLERQFTPNPEHKEHDERLREVCEEAIKFFGSVLAERKDVRDYLHSRGLHERHHSRMAPRLRSGGVGGRMPPSSSQKDSPRTISLTQGLRLGRRESPAKSSIGSAGASYSRYSTGAASR